MTMTVQKYSPAMRTKRLLKVIGVLNNLKRKVKPGAILKGSFVKQIK